jgi:endonuclease V-like protein UPF0215 family
MTYLIGKHRQPVQNWDEIRELLLDSSREAQEARKITASTASAMKKIYGICEIISLSGAVLTFALASDRYHLNKLLAIPNLLLAFHGNELRNMARNMEQLFQADASVRKEASSPERFLQTLYKGTLAAKYYFNWIGEKPQKAEVIEDLQTSSRRPPAAPRG